MRRSLASLVRASVLRTVVISPCKTEEGLDVLAPIVVEGVLVILRHPMRGEFPAVFELQVGEGSLASTRPFGWRERSTFRLTGSSGTCSMRRRRNRRRRRNLVA